MKFDNKTPNEITSELLQINPELQYITYTINALVRSYKGSMQEYQAQCLYTLCKPYNDENTRILEIGTGVGYSTAFIASACNKAKIVTLNPNQTEMAFAKDLLNKINANNVTYSDKMSENYYGLGNKYFDIVFVDGNHKYVSRDFQWWNNLNEKGLMIFHDYSPITQTHVFNELNKFCAEIGREDFDVYIMDNKQIGMVGFYR